MSDLEHTLAYVQYNKKSFHISDYIELENGHKTEWMETFFIHSSHSERENFVVNEERK